MRSNVHHSVTWTSLNLAVYRGLVAATMLSGCKLTIAECKLQIGTTIRQVRIRWQLFYWRACERECLDSSVPFVVVMKIKVFQL